MKMRLLRGLAALLLLAAPLASHAAINCSVSSPGFSAFYDPATPQPNVVQTYVRVSCTRNNNDANSIGFLVFAGNGNYATGSQNRAAMGSSRIRYDLHRNGNCTSPWQSLTSMAGTVSFGGANSGYVDLPYWGCVPQSQSVTPGTYVDAVTLTVLYSLLRTDTGIAPVTIVTPAVCSVTQAPGTLAFTYASFGPAVARTTPFRVNCANGLPYTMALDATSGTLLGLNYTLALSAATGVGTGVAQQHSINGTMAAGQSGTCASGTCTASQVRTLTITY